MQGWNVSILSSSETQGLDPHYAHKVFACKVDAYKVDAYKVGASINRLRNCYRNLHVIGYLYQHREFACVLGCDCKGHVHIERIGRQHA